MARETIVHLLNVPLENDYKHTVFFNNDQEQFGWFSDKVIHSERDLSYQRKDTVMRYPKHIDELRNCNYLMYRNSETSNKWIYAFITNMSYVSEGVTNLTIETDVLQTYMFDYVVNPSFVEREHVADDTIGLHTVPESLELGEYVCRSKKDIDELHDIRIIMGITEHFDTATWPRGATYNGVYSGLSYFSFSDYNHLNTIIEKYDEAGKGDAINCLFYAPKFLFDEQPDEPSFGQRIVVPANAVRYFGWGIKSPIVSESENFPYTPRNKKLNTYPFQYLLVSNNNGASAIYKYEYFKDRSLESADLADMLQFNVYGVLTPGCSIRLVPMYYKNVDENNEEGLNLGKFPICAWNTDVYTNWLTQNSVNIGLNLVASAGQVIGGAVMAVGSAGTAGAIGATQIIGGVSGIANQLAQIHQQSFAPPQTRGNVNAGDVTMAMGDTTFTFYGMTIKPEMMKIIDGYFDMFGYKVNALKVPEKDHRERWWFTKTIDVNIDGAIPMNDLQKIKNCYNNGITFWKNGDQIGRYDLSNRTDKEVAEDTPEHD